MKSFIALIFILQSGWAQTPNKAPLRAEDIIYNPGGNRPGRFVVSYKDYEDVRIDSDLDGKIDFWRVKKGPLQIETLYKNGDINTQYVRKVSKSLVSEYHYIAKNGKLHLVWARNRTPMELGFSPADDLCKTQLADMQDKLKEFSQELNENVIQDAITENLIDPSCKELMHPKELRRLSIYLNNTLSSQPDKLLTCFKNPKFKEAFKKGPDNALSFELLTTGYELQKMQLAQQSANNKPTFKCELTKEGVKSKPAKTSEKDRTITLQKPADDSADFPLEREYLEHELLHRMGLFPEQDVTNIQKICKDLSGPAPRLTGNNFKSYGMFVTPGNASAGILASNAEVSANINAGTSPKGVVPSEGNIQQGSALANQGVAANVPVEMTIAQTAAPSASTLSASISNPPPQTDAGAQAALTRSASESGGLLRVANNIAGAMSTPAAAAQTLASSSSPQRGPASANDIATSADDSVVGGRVPASTLLGVKSRSGLKSDERVVESITLDGVGAPDASRTSSSTQQKASQTIPNKSPNSAPADIAKAQNAASGDNEVSQAAGGGGASAASPSFSASSPSTQRNPASTNRGASSSSSSIGSKDEVITFISQSDYTSAKQKLRDPAFNRQLESQKITIMDLYGNSYGAKKGDVIFLDQGDRFVRQK